MNVSRPLAATGNSILPYLEVPAKDFGSDMFTTTSYSIGLINNFDVAMNAK